MPRLTDKQTAVIAAGAALSGPIDMSRFASGLIILPATWTAADIGAKVSDEREGTYVPLKDTLNGFSTDVSIDAPAASSAYPIPDYWFAAKSIKLWSHNGAGTDENQAAARSIIVLLKD